MSALGHVRIGHKAPYFQCEAVIRGNITEVTLNTYIRPWIKPGQSDPEAPWLIILFIPAAFSFVCPTEVLAFQNCLDEFQDRNCNIVFVSVDTKHSLWHWQNVPRQYGGLGQIDIPLLSDANHRIAQDYGVLIEEEGVSLRGMFILDNEGIVQQITLNNLTVGRSVLEALRLLEAFQAVAKHGDLCPVDWKPSDTASDTISTISNMLTESYDERLANLQKEFGHIPVTDLDAKHSTPEGPRVNRPRSTSSNSGRKDSDNLSRILEVKTPGSPKRTGSSCSPIQEVSRQRPKQNTPELHNSDTLTPDFNTTPTKAALSPPFSDSSSSRSRSKSLPPARLPQTPAPTPSIYTTMAPASLSHNTSTARHARGHSSAPAPPHSQLVGTTSSPSTPPTAAPHAAYYL